MNARQRAIRDEQKLERRHNILETAWQMFQQTNYTSVTIAEVAKASGLAKGRVYLYFKTKEEVFLSIQEEQLTAWFDEVEFEFTDL